MCRITVAVERPYKKETREGEVTADFINCVAFGKTAENINKYFSKGNRIAVSGRLQIDSYTDNNGNKKSASNIIIDSFEFLENKNQGNNNSNTSSTTNNEDFPWL